MTRPALAATDARAATPTAPAATATAIVTATSAATAAVVTAATVLLLLLTPPGAHAWNIEVVDAGAGIGGYSSLKVSPLGRVHISYFAGSQGHMKYAYWNGLQWAVETVDDNFLTGHHTSIDLDGAGAPHIAYRYYSGHNIRYASKTDGAWTFSDFETDPDMEGDISMALDATDRPHVSYSDGIFYGEAHDLKYATFDGAAWNAVVVDAPGQVGRGSAIAVDSRGHPHISYFDETHVTLKYARFDGMQWTVTTLDDVEYIGFNFRTAIAVDAQDHVHVAYSSYHYDNGNWYGRLKYARNDGAQWHVSIIDETLPTRDFRIPAVAVTTPDRPQVSYLLYYNVEAITPDLKYARYDGTSWQIEFIDQGDMADSDYSNAIDIDPSGRPHVSYAGNQSSLRHAVGALAADASESATPAGFHLRPPQPNPSDGATSIGFELPRAAEIALDLFDAGGRWVAALARGPYEAGAHAAALERGLPPGVYLCRLKAGGNAAATKLVIR